MIGYVGATVPLANWRPVGSADSRYAKAAVALTAPIKQIYAAVRGFCSETSHCNAGRSHLAKAANSSVFLYDWVCGRDRAFSKLAAGRQGGEAF